MSVAKTLHRGADCLPSLLDSKAQLQVIQKKKIARVYFNLKSLGKKQHPTFSLLNNNLHFNELKKFFNTTGMN